MDWIFLEIGHYDLTKNFKFEIYLIFLEVEIQYFESKSLWNLSVNALWNFYDGISL